MKLKIHKLTNWLKISIFLIFSIPLFFWNTFWKRDVQCTEWDDLMQCIYQEADLHDTIMKMGDEVKQVWEYAIWGGETEITFDWNPETKVLSAQETILVKVTKLLLSFVIAISITMILWNGIKYVIEIGNWKDSKDLVKNVSFIVVWIILALFSVTIITLIESIWTTLSWAKVEVESEGKTETKLVDGLWTTSKDELWQVFN